VRRGAAAICALGLLWLGGCAGFGQMLPPHCPVELVASEDLPADLWLRAKVRFAINDESVAVEAVARSGPDGLALAGIAPYGASLFALRQSGRDVSVESAATREQRYLAYFTLDALDRAYWIEAPAGGVDASWTRAGERVSDTTRDGVRRRVFSRSDADPPGHGDRPDAVTIEYPREAGGSLRIHNPWCGYEAIIVSIDAAGPRSESRSGDPGQDPGRDPGE